MSRKPILVATVLSLAAGNWAIAQDDIQDHPVAGPPVSGYTLSHIDGSVTLSRIDKATNLPANLDASKELEELKALVFNEELPLGQRQTLLNLLIKVEKMQTALEMARSNQTPVPQRAIQYRSGPTPDGYRPPPQPALPDPRMSNALPPQTSYEFNVQPAPMPNLKLEVFDNASAERMQQIGTEKSRTFKKKYAYGYIIFGPSDKGLANSYWAGRDGGTKVSLKADWLKSTYKYVDGVAELNLEDAQIDIGNLPAVTVRSALSIELKKGQIKSLFSSSNGVEVFLEVVDDDAADPVFALGFRRVADLFGE